MPKLILEENLLQKNYLNLEILFKSELFNLQVYIYIYIYLIIVYYLQRNIKENIIIHGNRGIIIAVI